jgi:hypothetical protein
LIRIAFYSAPTLKSLKLDFEASFGDRFYLLRDILKQCRGIRHLQLICFNMGSDVAIQDEDTLRDIMDGLSRLNRLDLIRCRRNVLSFINHTDIPNLQSFYYESATETALESEQIIVSAAMKYPTLTSIRLEAKFDSSASLLKVMAGFPDLEKLILRKKGGVLVLSRSDIISLRRLKSLDIACEVEDDAVSSLASCKSLKSLRVVDWDLSEVLSVIGGNLVSLEIRVASEAIFAGILKECVNLQYLDIGIVGLERSAEAIKVGLVKLANLKVNGASVRLGTDWMGINEY